MQTAHTQDLHTGLEVSLTVADRDVEIAFAVPRGQTLALVGPNGAGKTTTLQTLAGWLIPDTGYARLNQSVLFDCPSVHEPPQVWLPAPKRGIGYLAQDPQLFPHLTVRDNIAYGMKRAGIQGRKARRQAADTWLTSVGLAGLGHRKPAQLSGGQAQRVAIARVLASGPELILLDEPLAALDRQAAPAIRELLADVLRDRTVVLVSHGQVDVDALADIVQPIGISPSE